MLYSDILYAAIAKFILTILTASNCVCNRFSLRFRSDTLSADSQRHTPRIKKTDFKYLLKIDLYVFRLDKILKSVFYFGNLL